MTMQWCPPCLLRPPLSAYCWLAIMELVAGCNLLALTQTNRGLAWVPILLVAMPPVHASTINIGFAYKIHASHTHSHTHALHTAHGQSPKQAGIAVSKRGKAQPACKSCCPSITVPAISHRLSLLARQRLLIGTQHRSGCRVGSLLEKRSSGSAVRRARLCALQAHSPPAARRVAVCRLRATSSREAGKAAASGEQPACQER